MNGKWIFFLVLVLAVLQELLRRSALNKHLKEIYKAVYVQKDEELFHLLICSPQSKMLMSDSSRAIIELNAYIAFDREEKVVKTVEKLKRAHLDKKKQKGFFTAAIGYYAEKGRADTLDLLNLMKEKCDQSKDSELMLLFIDCQLTYDVYIAKDTSKIEVLQELIQTDISAELKSVYQYRLAKLYYVMNEQGKCIDQLKQAYTNTSSTQARKKIDRILKGEWELL